MLSYLGMFSLSACEWKKIHTYEVTGISPQSRTVAQLLKGFVASGTLYPPLFTCQTLIGTLAVKKILTIGSVGGTLGEYQKDRNGHRDGTMCRCQMVRLCR